MFKQHINESDSEYMQVYGFSVCRKDGYSMPKGMITSFNAYLYKHPTGHHKVEVEFSIQAPTGDASDHCHYTFPCLDFDQAKRIVNEYAQGVWEMLERHEKESQPKRRTDILDPSRK
jgi:hypothetical protein